MNLSYHKTLILENIIYICSNEVQFNYSAWNQEDAYFTSYIGAFAASKKIKIKRLVS